MIIINVKDLIQDAAKRTGINFEQADETTKAMVAVMNNGDYDTVGKLSSMLRSLKKKKDAIKIAKLTAEETGYPIEEVRPIVDYMLDFMKKSVSTRGMPAVMSIVKQIKEANKEERKEKKKEKNKKGERKA